MQFEEKEWKDKVHMRTSQAVSYGIIDGWVLS